MTNIIKCYLPYDWLKTNILSFILISFITNLSAQTWDIQNSYIGSPIDDGVGFSIGDIGYVGSGRDVGFQYRSDFYKFESSQWEQIASINGTPRQYASSFSFPNTGCIVTGLAPQDSLLTEIQCYSVGND